MTEIELYKEFVSSSKFGTIGQITEQFYKKYPEYVAIPITIQEQPQEEDLPRDLILSDKSMLIKKVMFYREQTEKLRNYIHENKIGNPYQGFFDAILEHLENRNQSQEQTVEFCCQSELDGGIKCKTICTDCNPCKSQSEAVEFKDWCDKNTYKLEMREETCFTNSQLYEIFKKEK